MNRVCARSVGTERWLTALARYTAVAVVVAGCRGEIAGCGGARRGTKGCRTSRGKKS